MRVGYVSFFTCSPQHPGHWSHSLHDGSKSKCDIGQVISYFLGCILASKGAGIVTLRYLICVVGKDIKMALQQVGRDNCWPRDKTISRKREGEEGAALSLTPERGH